MRNFFAGFGFATLFGLGFIALGSPSSAESVMKMCGEQWQAAKAAGTTHGETWPQFLAQCRTQQTGGGAATAAPTHAPTPATPPQNYGQAPAAGMTTRQCDAEYEFNKAAIRASGQTKRAFVAACRSGSGTIPQGTAAAPPPSYQPAPVPAPAPTTGSLVPSPQPAAPPTEPPYSSVPTPMGNGEFASDQQARSHCPTDTVVWVNTRSGVYHFVGTHNYGHTKEGAYMCEADARAAGDRAAMNEHHP